MSHDLLTEIDFAKRLESEIHVWFCFPDEIRDKAKIQEYFSILSVAEQEKYSRFHFEKDRHSYLVSHALVRKVLSRYGRSQAEEWCFELNQFGKPAISLSDDTGIKFNLSHTDGLSACVITLGNDCGVDVENVERKNKSLAVAERMFAETEVEVMQICDESERQNKFFEFWTLREAYVKALGTGLGGSSKDFYFTVDRQSKDLNAIDGKVASIHFDKSIDEYENAWKFVLLSPSVEHVAAVAVLNESGAEKEIVSRVIQP